MAKFLDSPLLKDIIFGFIFNQNKMTQLQQKEIDVRFFNARLGLLHTSWLQQPV